MIRLRTLGPLRLERDGGTPVGSILAQPKRLALLVYLSAAHPPATSSRDTLLALLWPELDDAHARAALRQGLHLLRRSLDQRLITGTGDERVGIDASRLWCDAAAFGEALATGDTAGALALYRGPFLDGFHVSEAPEFERWVEHQRHRLQRDAVTAACDLADVAEAAGDRADARRWAGRALELAPYDEEIFRRYVGVLERQADGAAAVAAFAAYERRLAEDLALAPSAETVAVLARIRGGGGAVVAARSASLPLPPSEHSPSAAGPMGSPAGEEVDAAVAPAGASVPGGRRVAYLTAAAIVLLVGVGAYARWARPQAGAKASPAAHAEASDSLASVGAVRADLVAVAPFENRTGDASLAPVGTMAAEWITRGLTQSGVAEVADFSLSAAPVTDRASLQTLAQQTGAGLVVSGSYYRNGADVLLMARVTDTRTGKVLYEVGPVRAPIPEPLPAVEQLRSLLVGALATRRNKGWTQVQVPGEEPPTYEAYREFIEGLYADVVGDDFRQAVRHFSRAFALDSTFYLALIWAANDAAIGSWAAYDSLATRLERIRDRLAPADRALMDLGRAFRAKDWRANYAAARALSQAMPGSVYAVWALALAAGKVHRYHESLALLARIDPDRGLSHFKQYWTFVAGARHALGDFEGELRAAAELARRSPESPVPAALRLSALAALGRADEVRPLASALAERLVRDTAGQNELWKVESLGFPPRTPVAPYFLAARELLAHGHAAASRQVTNDALAWCADRPGTEQSEDYFRWLRAQLLGMAGRWREARAVLEGDPANPRRRAYYEWYRGVAAANLGDRARVATAARTLSRPFFNFYDPEVMRLSLAAALGQREEVLGRLRDMHAAGGDYGEWWLHTEPTLAPYTADPEVRHLLAPDN